MDEMTAVTPPQLYRKAEELKVLVGKKRNLFHDGEGWTTHQELQSLLQKLLLVDLDYALDKKVEVELWSVCFKDYISHLQTVSRDKSPLKKKQSTEAQVTLTWFLNMASGFYLMLMQEIRSSFELDLPFLRDGPTFGKFQRRREESIKPSHANCLYICQHCLVHLGDLARYRNQARQAESFYRQAIAIAPGSGQAYNQIALLEANQGDMLSAAFFYVRALALKYPFPAAASNLTKLFGRIEQNQKSLPFKAAKINAHNFVPYVLRFHALVHHAQHLKTAAKICQQLNDSLTSLVAAESLTTLALLQVVAVNLFLIHQNVEDPEQKALICPDEKEIAALLCEFVAGMLNALLLPVYMLKQGESLLDYFALPAAKLILDWITLNPWCLEEKAFLKRLQIWPSLCRMLNELSNLTFDKNLERWDCYPLPEDYDLQAFLPLLPRLRRCNFKQMLKSSIRIPEDEQRLLRAKRMTELGQFLASPEFGGRQMIAAKGFDDIDSSTQLTFEAIEHKVPEKLICELDVMELESSSEEEVLCGDNVEELEESENSSENKTMGILKGQSEPQTVMTVTNGILGLPSKKLGQRTNVAMAAIMANIGGEPHGGKQVTFKSPSPAPSNSQDSSTLSQDSSSLLMGGNESSLLQRLTSQNIVQASAPRCPPLPSPARPPPDFSVPPPPVLNPQRPSFGLIAPSGSALRGTYSEPCWANAASTITRPFASGGNVSNPRMNITLSSNAHFGTLDRGSTLYPSQTDYSLQLLNLLGNSNHSLGSPVASVLPVSHHNQGPSYSLFSGPNWSGGHGSLLGNPRQDPNRFTNSEPNMFQPGPSALETFLRQQKKD